MNVLRGLLPMLFLLPAISPVLGQVSPSPDEQVAGVWRGHSVCTVKSSPCHDEVNVYRVSVVAGKPGAYLVAADKIVDGKEVEMGTGEWTFDSMSHSLVYVFPKGTFRLKVTGGKMEGELKLPDGTLYRQIWLEKEK